MIRFIAGGYDDSAFTISSIGTLNQDLYRPGNTIGEFEKILGKNMCYVENRARMQGYELWKMSDIVS